MPKIEQITEAQLVFKTEWEFDFITMTHRCVTTVRRPGYEAQFLATVNVPKEIADETQVDFKKYAEYENRQRILDDLNGDYGFDEDVHDMRLAFGLETIL